MSNLILPRMNYETLSELATNGDQWKKIAYATYVRVNNGDVSVKHHDSTIATITRNGDIYLDNNGYESCTTANRLDKILLENSGRYRVGISNHRMVIRDMKNNWKEYPMDSNIVVYRKKYDTITVGTTVIGTENNVIPEKITDLNLDILSVALKPFATSVHYKNGDPYVRVTIEGYSSTYRVGISQGDGESITPHIFMCTDLFSAAFSSWEELRGYIRAMRSIAARSALTNLK